MARVRDIGSAELPPEAREVYERFVAGYGPFRNQVAVFAHSPPAVEHLMGLLLDLRQSGTIRRRHLELAIVAVSKLNECHYCVAHHKPMLMVEGLTSAGAELRLANGVVLLAKFDGEFASHSSTYAGTGTVRYAW